MTIINSKLTSYILLFFDIETIVLSKESIKSEFVSFRTYFDNLFSCNFKFHQNKLHFVRLLTKTKDILFTFSNLEMYT